MVRFAGATTAGAAAGAVGAAGAAAVAGVQLWPSQVLLMQLWLTVLRPLALLILLRPLVLRRQFPAEMHQFPGLPGCLYDGVSSPAGLRAGQVG